MSRRNKTTTKTKQDYLNDIAEYGRQYEAAKKKGDKASMDHFHMLANNARSLAGLRYNAKTGETYDPKENSAPFKPKALNTASQAKEIVKSASVSSRLAGGQNPVVPVAQNKKAAAERKNQKMQQAVISGAHQKATGQTVKAKKLETAPIRPGQGNTALAAKRLQTASNPVKHRNAANVQKSGSSDNAPFWDDAFAQDGRNWINLAQKGDYLGAAANFAGTAINAGQSAYMNAANNIDSLLTGNGSAGWINNMDYSRYAEEVAKRRGQEQSWLDALSQKNAGVGLIARMGTEALTDPTELLAGGWMNDAAKAMNQGVNAAQYAKDLRNGTIAARNMVGLKPISNAAESTQDAVKAAGDVVPDAYQTAKRTIPEAAETAKHQIPNTVQAMQNPEPAMKRMVPDAAQAADTVEAVKQPAKTLNPEIRSLTSDPSSVLDGFGLGDDAGKVGQNIIAKSESIGKSPREICDIMLNQYDNAYEEAVKNAEEYVKSYQPQGVSVVKNADGTGYRVSNNEQWYSDFYKKNGRSPGAKDRRKIAEELVKKDKTGSMFGWSESSQQKKDILDELNRRVFDRDGVSRIEKADDGTWRALYDQGTENGKMPFGKNTVGSAERNPYSFDAALNEYGAIKPGEPKARIVDVPKSMDGETKVRQATRTFMEAPQTPDEMLGDFEDAVERGLFTYEPQKHKVSMERAAKKISEQGFDKAMSAWDTKMYYGEAVTQDDIASAILMYTQAAKNGDTKTAMNLAGQISAEMTRSGQNISAMRMLKRTTPEGKLAYLERAASNLSDAHKKKLKGKKIQINKKMASDLLNAQTPEAIKQAEAAIIKNIADQLPNTWADKWNAWRYLAMLGNPRTHIRNMTGNVLMQVPRFVKDRLGALIEIGTDAASRAAGKSGIERSKSLLPGVLDGDARRFAKEDFSRVEDVISGADKYNPSDMIRQAKDPFSKKWIGGRLLNKASSGNSWALDAEDALFKRATYTDALAGYIRANKLDTATLIDSAGNASKDLEKARTYAINEALKATFQDESKIATALSKLEGTNAATKIAMGGLVPFKKTPINVVKRGLEYSPAGLIKAVTKDAVDLKKGTKTAAEVIDDVSKGLTGTGLMLLGYELASNGLVNGSGSEKKKEQNFDEMLGIQSYSLNVGDYSYTIDWSAPASLPIFMGVELFDAINNGDVDESTATKFFNAMANISEPVFSLTMLDGIETLVQSAAYGKNTPVTNIAGNIVQDYVGQAIPTVLGQLARTVDGTRRTTYQNETYKTGVAPLDAVLATKSMNSFLQRNQAKIPVLSKKLVPRLDAFGRTDTDDNVVRRAIENFLSPGYISKKNDGAVEAELNKLYAVNRNTAVLPGKAEGTITVNGKNVALNARQYMTYANTRGREAYNSLENLFQSNAYKYLTQEEKENAVQKVYQYANAVGKNQVSSYALEKNQTNAKASGNPGAYYAYSSLFSMVQGNQDTSSAKNAVLNALESDTSISDGLREKIIKSVILSEKRAQEYDEKFKDTMSITDYANVSNIYAEVNAMDAKGGAKATEFSKRMDEEGYTGEVRDKINEEFVYYNQAVAKSENYTWEMMETNGSSDIKAALPAIRNTFESAEAYNKLIASMPKFDAKDANGKSVSGLKKKRVSAWVKQNTSSDAQYRSVMKSLGYK